MPHPNDMTRWERIACERGCARHHSYRVTVDLTHPHGYHDYPQFPERLARRFSLYVWDPAEHPVDDVGIYCPAHDAVSETIVSHHVWEPRETILMLDVLTSPAAQRSPTPVMFLDIGCQIGWFSIAAMSVGARVLAVDAELENLRLVAHSAAEMRDHPRDGHDTWFETRMLRVGPGSDPFPVRPYRLVKVDIEGAEADAVRMLQPAIDAGFVDHMLIEVSPVFKPGDHYPDLVADLVASGFECYMLPPKRHPAWPYDDAHSYLEPYRIDSLGTDSLRAMVRGWHQEDLWFHRVGAPW
jgi:hypothetical protein